MPLEDVNQATYSREAEKTMSSEESRKAIANFAKLKTPEDRLTAFRKLRGGSMTKAPSTKMGNIPDTI